MLPEVRMARVLDAIASHRAGRLSCVEAGELLGFSERHFRRLCDAFEERGEDGLIDRRCGRVKLASVPPPAGASARIPGFFRRSGSRVGGAGRIRSLTYGSARSWACCKTRLG